jgi:hypothetical protein
VDGIPWLEIGGAGIWAEIMAIMGIGIGAGAG